MTYHLALLILRIMVIECSVEVSQARWMVFELSSKDVFVFHQSRCLSRPFFLANVSQFSGMYCFCFSKTKTVRVVQFCGHHLWPLVDQTWLGVKKVSHGEFKPLLFSHSFKLDYSGGQNQSVDQVTTAALLAKNVHDLCVILVRFRESKRIGHFPPRSSQIELYYI